MGPRVSSHWVGYEALTTTHSFVKSDKPFFSTVSIRSFSPCQPTQPLPSFLTLGIPIRPFQVEFTISWTPLPRAGAPTWGIPRSRVFGPFRTKAPHQCFGAQGGNTGPPSLGLSIAGPPGYVHYRQHHCCSLYQQTGWDPFPHPVAADSGSVSLATDPFPHPVAAFSGSVFLATDSRYSHQGQTNSGLPKCDSRPVISAAHPAHHDRVASPPRNSEPDIRDLGNPSSGHVCHSPQHLPQFIFSVLEH